MEVQHISPSGTSHFRTIQRQESFELDLEPVISCGRVGSVTVIRPQPRTPVQSPDSRTMQNTNSADDSDVLTHHPVKPEVDSLQAHQSMLAAQDRDVPCYSASLSNSTDYLDGKNSTGVTTVIETGRKGSVGSVTKLCNGQKQPLQHREDCTATTCPSSTESAYQGSGSSALLSEGHSGIDPCAEGGEVDSDPSVVRESDGGSLTNKPASKVEMKAAGGSKTAPDVIGNSSEASSKVGHQAKKKGEAFKYFCCFFYLRKIKFQS